MRGRTIDRIEVTDAQVEFCKRRTAFLMQDADVRTLTFLLANAYHQGLSDAQQALSRTPKDQTND